MLKIFLIFSIILPNVWAYNCPDSLIHFFKNFTDSKLSNLGSYNFGNYAYDQAADVLKKQVDEWVLAAKDNPSEYLKLQSHQQHLRNLEEALDAHAKNLEAFGVNVERVRAAIYAHDIGKFIAADQQVRLHYSLRKFEGKDPDVLIDFLRQKQGMNRSQAQAFLEQMAHDRRYHTTNTLFEMEEYRFLKETLTEDNQFIDFFAEFLDHSQTSRQWLREHPIYGVSEVGGPDNLTRQLMLDSVGHDGPPSAGSWWGQTYGNVTGMTYPSTRTTEAQVLQLLDRLDQAGAVVRGNILSGGPRKIGYQMRSDNLKGARLIDYSINNVVDGTEDQVKYLQRSFGASMPGNLDKVIEQNISSYRHLRRATTLYELDGGSAPATFSNAIGEIQVRGKTYYFSDLEDFYGTDQQMGAATLWWSAHQ